MAFSSLIARNKINFESDLMSDVENDAGDDDDVVKIKLPFIVVNTSKETAIDCWLSADR